MPRVAFSTLSCPDWSWREILENGTRSGYNGVEVRLVARETDLLKVPEFRSSESQTRRRELGDAGFQVCGLASSVQFHDPAKSQRDEQLATGRAYVDLAAELGASFVRVFGDVLPAQADESARRSAIQRIAEGLDRLGEYAAKANVEILIETHGDFCDSRVMRELLDRVKCPAVGLLWDTHHPWRFYGEPLVETFERLRPWLRHTHWKDSVTRPQPRDDDAVRAAAEQAHALMGGHRHADYALFGGGEFPAQECVHLLRSAGYDGWLCLEWEKMWHPEIEGPEIAVPLFPAKIRRLWDAFSLADFQALIATMYSSKDEARGIEGTFMWLIEEIGELASALRQGTAEELAAEFADVLAWLVTIANVARVDLEQAVRKKYGGGCPGCGELVCRCDLSEKP